MTNTTFKTVDDFAEACLKATNSSKVARKVALEAKLDILFEQMDQAKTCGDYEIAWKAYERANAEYKALCNG